MKKHRKIITAALLGITSAFASAAYACKSGEIEMRESCFLFWCTELPACKVV